MAALLDLYYDTRTKELVQGLSGPAGFAIPPLRQEEGLRISLNLVKRIKTVGIGPFYERINATGYTLQISVSSPADVDDVLASASASPTDASLGTFDLVLPLNTAGINALSDGAAVYFEVRLFDGTYYSGRRFDTRVEKGVALAGSPQPIAGDTALGALEGSRTFLLKNGSNGEARIWRSADGSVAKIQYLHNDGTLHLDPIT